MIVLDALDALALALTAHGHQWSDRERLLYESAIAGLTSLSRRATEDLTVGTKSECNLIVT
jgi:hypothetical protein